MINRLVVKEVWEDLLCAGILLSLCALIIVWAPRESAHTTETERGAISATAPIHYASTKSQAHEE